MRKIMALAAFILAVLLLLPIVWHSNSTIPDKDNNTASLNEPEQIEYIENIILPGFDYLDINKPGRILCNMNENFYLQFNIILKDTEEIIYSSGLVEYNSYINNITLTKEIEEGEYEALIFIQPYDLKGNKTNSALLEIKLKV
ncbi:MAG: hypothetical protein ACI32B_03210 [Erysipelotrichaceae bacterium]